MNPSLQPKNKVNLWFVIVPVVLVLVGGSVWFFKHLAQNNSKPVGPSSNSSQLKDTTAPAITISNISNNQTLSGIAPVTVTATDNVAVIKVEYYVDNVFFAVNYATPFGLSLDTGKLTNGQHTLIAKAYDAAGNATSSSPITFQIGPSQVPVPATEKTTSTAKKTGASPSPSPTPPPGPDTTAPSAPSNVMLSANDGYTVHVSWTASTDNVGVTGYKVYRDNALLGTATSTSYTDQTVVPGNTYAYSVTASDTAGNVSATSTQPSITLVTTSIWVNADSPGGFFDNGGPLELGVKFRTLVDGQITGVRFYKDSADSGTHTGTLWTSGGSSLATATFTNETTSGWQQVTFSTPVSVTAGTTYVASYYNPLGKYGANADYFTNLGVTSQYVKALAEGVDGHNGLFSTSAGFPTSSFLSNNYWVDVSFIPNPNAGGPAVVAADNSQITANFPGSDNTGVTVGLRLPTRDRGVTINHDGDTLENLAITGDNVVVNANNATIRNMKLTDQVNTGIIVINSGKTNTTIQDVTIDGQHNNSYGINSASATNTTISRVNIMNSSNGIQPGDNTTIQDSFMHDFDSNGSSAVVINGNHNTISILRNNILVSTAISDVSITNCFGAINAITVNANRLIGGSYNLYSDGHFDTNSSPPCNVGGAITNVTITNNRFGGATFGYASIVNNIITQSGNVDDTSGLPITL